jgi:hypothetical protein
MLGEAARLRIALRDLVAISALPAAWVGREPSTIAEGLADVLAAALQLDFVFVRFHPCNGAAAVDAIRGDDRRPFAEWLRRHLATFNRGSRRELVVDVGDNVKRYCGFVLPVGFDAATGVIAAASERPGFPSESDRLLLRVATNHAVTAYRSALLVHELRLAEDRLRIARDELELKVRNGRAGDHQGRDARRGDE